MRLIGSICAIVVIFTGMGSIVLQCASHGSSNIKPQQQNTEPKITNQTGQFTKVSAAKGTNNAGAPFSTQVYESPNGDRVTLTRENYDSEGRASTELQKRAKQAVEIIEQGKKTDGNGKVIGVRVAATFTDGDSKTTQAVVFWNDSQQLYSIRCYSMAVALEFETQRHN